MISLGHASSNLPAPAESDWLKADFHIHTREDPKDFLDYTAHDLLARAHDLGFRVLAITLHGKVLEDPALTAAAAAHGIRLIPGTELRLEGADVVLLNVSAREAAAIHKWSDLAPLRERRGKSVFIIAPHPYFLLGGSMGERRLLDSIDLFDALEVCHFHTAWFNRNRRTFHMAERFHKPLVATSDAHRLSGFGRHFSLIQAPADATPEAIFEAIRAGCVKPVSPDLTGSQVARQLWWMFVTHKWQEWQARFGAKRS
jgi:predicted metal-dependent phosphoesterase TrpH